MHFLKHRLIAFSFALLTKLAAETPQEPVPTPQPVSLVNFTTAPSSFVNNSVSAISGDYIYSSQEHISSGPDPYALGTASISSQEILGSAGYSADFQHPHLLKVFQPAGIQFKEPSFSTRTNYTYLYIYEPFGGKILFRGTRHAKHFEPVLKGTGYTNTSQGSIEGKNHIKNWTIWWDSTANEWHAITANGTERIYGQRFRNKEKRKPGYYNYYFRDYHIIEEKRPSGNRVLYRYNKEYKIEKIKTVSADKSVILNWVHFAYSGDQQEVVATTSDTLTYIYKLKKMKTRKDRERYFIESIIRPGMTAEKIEYGEATSFHNPRIEKAGREGSAYVKTKYYHRLGENEIGAFRPEIKNKKRRKFLAGRVRLQKSPVGVAGEEVMTHSYFYHRNEEGEIDCTTVVDAYGTKMRYFYDENARLKRIEHEKDGVIILAEQFLFGKEGDENEGCLIARVLFDETKRPLLARTYEYDSHFNVIKETLFGHFTGASKGSIKLDSKGYPESDSHIDQKVWRCTFSKDRFNLKLSQEDPLGNFTYFQYQKETNLLTARFTCDGKTIKKREFFKYDATSSLIKEIIDDGSSEDVKDLKNVTMRKITRFKLRNTLPHFGTPEEISEYALDLERGQERFLKRVVNSFDARGLIVKKELYNENLEKSSTFYYDYDTAQRLTYSRDPLGREQFLTYDEAGRLASKKGPRDDVEERYKYDEMGRLVASKEIIAQATSLVSRVKFDLLGRKIATIDPQGNETKYEYDALNRITKIILPEILLANGEVSRAHRSFRYKQLSTRIIETDERGYETEREYSATGKLLKERLPDGQERRFYYDLLDRKTAEVSPSGLTTLTTYDYAGRPLTVVEKVKSDILLLESRKYSTFFLSEETFASQEKRLHFYDYAGRKSKVIQVGGTISEDRTRTFHYDAMGRLKQEKVHLDKNRLEIHAWEYDTLDRVLFEAVSDESGKLYSSKALSYDQEGNVAEITQSIGGKKATTKTSYFPHGIPAKIEDALGNVTHFSVNYFFKNRLGQYVIQKNSTDARGVKACETLNARGLPVKCVQYDPFGRLIQKKRLFYDPHGNQVRIEELVLSATEMGKDQSESQKEVITTSLQYGPLNRLEALIQASGTPEELVERFSYNRLGQKTKQVLASGVELRYEYDLKGRLTRSFDSIGQIGYLYEYDASDRILSVTNTHTHAATKRRYNRFGEIVSETLETNLTSEYSYDKLGRLEVHTLPDLSKISYSYSPAGLTAATRQQSSGKSYTYTVKARDLSEHMLQSELPLNGGALFYEYDLLGRITKMTHPIFQESIPKNGYDPIGNLTCITWQNPFGNFGSNYSYNSLSQLTQESGVHNHTYASDSLDSRQKKDDVSYVSNALHELLSAKAKYRYDATGNRIKKSDGNQECHYRYDSLNRLVSYESATKLVEYSYDAFHRRTKKRVFTKSSRNGDVEQAEERYLLLNQNEIGTVDAAGSIKELRVLGTGLGAEIGAAIALELNNSVYIPLHDHRGNVTLLLQGETGALQELYSYSAFGEESCVNAKQESIHTALSPWRFASKRVDPESGLVYFGRRYYDPSVGSWLTQDPLGMQAGPNLYAYVHNNPLTKIDLYGLATELISRNGNPVVSSHGGPDPSAECFETNNSYDHDPNWLDRAANQAIQGFGSLLRHSIISNPITNSICDGIYNYTHAEPREKIGSMILAGAHGNQYANYTVPINMPINGMLNSKADAIQMQSTIQNKFGPAAQNNTISIYNATAGAVSDACELGVSLLGFHTHPSRILTSTIRQIIEAHKNNPAPILIRLLPHSHGCAVTHLALKELSREELKRIAVCTFGPTKLITEKEHHVAEALNIVSRSDYTTLFCDPVGFARAVHNPASVNVKFVGSALRVPMSTHAFHGSDYQGALAAYANQSG